VEFLSTPFSLEAVEMLERIGVNAFKVASMDCCNRLLLKKIAKTGKPIYLSTGMANYVEIRSSIEFLEKENAGPVTVLHCISKYPSVKEDLKLGVIPALKDALDKPVGYSDHYPGNKACIAAITLGASVIETHFTDDTSREGGDHHHSCDPESLRELVEFAGDYPVMAEGGLKSLEDRSDREFAPVFRRGVYAETDLPAGTVLTVDNLLFCRPESALGPSEELLGKKLKTGVQALQPIEAVDLEG
jgi:sialic acid synthase SpsE